MPRKRTTETDLPVAGGAVNSPRRPTTPKARVKRTPKPVESDAQLETSGTRPTEETTTSIVETPVSRPTREEIARLAFSFWEARGCQGGSAEDDWIRAEQQLLSARAATATA